MDERVDLSCGCFVFALLLAAPFIWGYLWLMGWV